MIDNRGDTSTEPVQWRAIARTIVLTIVAQSNQATCGLRLDRRSHDEATIPRRQFFNIAGRSADHFLHQPFEPAWGKDSQQPAWTTGQVTPGMRHPFRYSDARARRDIEYLILDGDPVCALKDHEVLFFFLMKVHRYTAAWGR